MATGWKTGQLQLAYLLILKFAAVRLLALASLKGYQKLIVTKPPQCAMRRFLHIFCLGQSAIAKSSFLVGVTESTIRNLKRNRNGVEQIERIIKLCRALKCSAEEIN